MATSTKLKGFISDDEMSNLEKSSPKQSGFVSDEDMAKLESNNGVSRLESSLRGAAQGASLNYADEITGAGEALLDDLKYIFNRKSDPNAPKPVYDKFGRVVNASELKGTYEKHRDESRENYKKAQEANPGAYTAGEIGGGLALAAIPMGSSATLANVVVNGGKLGALASLGASESGSLDGQLKDAATGAVMGAAGAAGARAIEKAIPLVKGGVKTLSDKLTQKSIDTAEQVLSKESGSIPIATEQSVFKDAATNAKNRIKSFWNPEVDPKYSEFLDIAKKNNIDPNLLPEAVKFGPDSSASRAARSFAEGRFGEESLKRFNKGLDQVREAYNGKINNYSKGVPVDEITAGKILRDSYDEGVSKFFDQMDITHNQLMDLAPGLQITPEAQDKISQSLNGIEKFAKGRLERGVTNTQKQQGQQLLNAVEAIRAGNGSYKQTVEALRDIGEAAYQTKNSMSDIPVDVEKMRKIYNDLNEGLVSSVRSQLGDDIANSLVKNNEMMSDFFGDRSLVSKVLGDKSVSPENAFKSLLLSGDSQKIEALKKVITPERWNYLKGAVLENISKRDPEGNFTFKQLYNSMRNKRSALSSIFDPQELSENAGLVRLGDRFGSPYLSSSGTGASFSFQDAWKTPLNLSVDSLALKNANKALKKEAEDVVVQKAKDVSPALKELPTKVAGVLAGIDSAPAKKGPDKWASDGADKLLQHDPTINPKTIEKLKQTKKGRDILFRASDLKPGSKAMDRIANEINSAEEQ